MPGRRKFAQVLMTARDRVISDTLTIILCQSGYETIAAGSIKEALNEFSKHPIRCAFLEALLPYGDGSDIRDGIGLAAYIRDFHPHCEVVITGGDRVAIAELLGRPAGRGDRFRTLFYPIHREDLLSVMEQVVGIRKVS